MLRTYRCIHPKETMQGWHVSSVCVLYISFQFHNTLSFDWCLRYVTTVLQLQELNNVE